MNETNNWRTRPFARVVVYCSCTFMLLTSGGPLYAAPPILALPTGGVVTHGSATINTVGNTMTVNQTSNKAILGWDSFNIGNQAAVQFNQPSASAIALNKIGGNSASEIFGKLSANGNIYLINNNGIVFGNGAQVNVHGLLASTLNIDTNQFLNSSLATAINEGKAALEGGTAAGAKILVQSGAQIRTDTGGQVLMFAPSVINQGDIATPDGQTLLAASNNKVYLVVSDNSDSMRGLLVEVDSGGSVENVGQIVAERGNVTLLGLAVNQNGRVRATTSVDVNGSVRLIARDGASIAAVSDNNKKSFADAQFFKDGTEISASLTGVGLPIANHSGTVTFGAGSTTEVTADSSGKTATNASAQPLSRIQVMGEKIELKPTAQIVAHGGQVDLVATAKPDSFATSSDTTGHIYLGENSKIDVSGEHVELPVERRVVEVELRGDELKDAPLQRYGVLRGKTVKVDIDKGSPLISDLAPWLAKVQKGVKERLTAAGKINLRSSNDVVMANNAGLDISGGSISYASGVVTTTKLMSQGRVFDIGSADPNRIYDGVLGEHSVTHSKWGKIVYGSDSVFAAGTYSEGYTQGQAGGELSINTNALYGFDLADLRAATTAGIKQRSVALSPTGSKVNITTLSQNILMEQSAHSANFAADTLLSPVSGTWPSLYLSADKLNSSGLRELTLTAGGKFQVASTAQLALGAGSKLNVDAIEINIDGKLRLPSGEVTLKTTVPTTASGLGNFPVYLGANSVIDVSGLWTNDLLAVRNGSGIDSVIAPNGGKISLTVFGDVDIAAGAKLRADAGAQLTSSGQINGGNGGAISLITQAKFGDNRGSVLTLPANALSAYGFQKGGTLTLGANSVMIGATVNDPHTLSLGEDFFSQGGFSAYTVNANLHGIQVADNAQVNLSQKNYLITDIGAASRVTSGTDIHSLVGITALRDELRAPVDLTLVSERSSTAVGGVSAPVRLGSNSRISGEPGAKIKISGDDSIYIDGTIYAPGGSIGVNLATLGNDVYRPELAIWFDENAHLLAPAVRELKQNSTNLLLADIYDAGTISVTAERGSIVAKSGSTFNVDGAEFALDRPRYLGGIQFGYQRQPVYAAAGSIDFTAAESLLIYSDLSGKAAGNGLGGAVSFRLDGGKRSPSKEKPFPITAPSIDVYAQLPQWNSTLAFGSAIPSGFSQRGLVGVDRISEGGFSRLTLGAANLVGNDSAVRTLASYGSVRFMDDVAFSLTDSIWFDVTSINTNNHSVNISAASAQLGQSDNEIIVAQQAQTPAAGSGEFNLVAKFIELIGNFSIGGASHTTLHSDGDIRLRSLVGIDGTTFARVLAPAKLTVAGDLDLAAAQIYPSTLSDYTIQLTGANSVLRTAATGARTPILSAAGKLTLLAPHIEHGGVVAAPLGQIVLGSANTQSVHLLNGSTLDVSSNYLVPFGNLRGTDIDWIYPINSTYPLVIGAPPEKRVDIVAANVAMDDGSRVNLSGGGDIYAYEFVAGPGGSKDFLDTENANGAFAVVPWLNSPITPYDTVEMSKAGIEAGSVVYLNGSVAGLAAGYYAVLPAHYALLPGAYLLTPNKSSWNPGQSGTLIDGTPVVAGRFGRAFTDQLGSQWTGFSVETGAAARLRSEYKENTGDKFFADAGVDRAVDAGKMSIDADSSLVLRGIIDAQTQNGRGAQLDIIADAIEVVDQLSTNSNTIQLEAGALNRLGVDSLMLGGRRTRAGTDTTITVGANSVSVRSGAELSVPDLLLAARDTVQLDAGAKITSSGQSTVATERFLLNGDGAFLRASSGGQADVVRTGVVGATGNLLIKDGSSITGSKSVLVDSTANMSLAGQLALNQGSLNLTANRISVGAVPANTSGVALSSADVAALNAATLRLSSRNGIDFYGDIDFSNEIVELNAGSLRNMTPGVTRIGANNTLQLSNTAKANASPAGTSGASLVLTAQHIELGSERDHGSTMKLQGFNTVQLGSAAQTKEVVGQGQFTLTSDGAVSIVADRVTTSTGATTAIEANGAVDLARANAAELTTASLLGGSLRISGKNITQGTAIDMASGRVELLASGADASDGVHLLNGSSINVSGRSIDAPQGWVSSAGGNILLRSVNGNINADTGATVALAGGEHGGDAGTLTAKAESGNIIWAAITDAHAVTTANGGSLELSANTINDFSGWLNRVADSGFDKSVRLHAGTGDLQIDRNVRAHTIDISTDSGLLTLTATLDASASKGGQVTLFAGNNLELATGSRIDAHATDADARGGKVILGTTNGTLLLGQNSTIDVSGGVDGSDTDTLAGRNGRVQLRVPRIANNSDVAVIDSGVTITGAEAIVIEAVSAYTGIVLNSTDTAWTNALAAAHDFMNQTNVDSIKSRLGAWAQSSIFHLRPGIEIDSDTNITVAGDAIDFSGVRFGANNEPGVLTLRAKGDVIFETSLLDGLVSEADVCCDADGFQTGLNFFTGGVPNMLLMSGESWQFRAVAGAKANAANPLALMGVEGDIRLVDGADLITGAADIDLSAAHDIVATKVDTVIASLGLSPYRNYGFGPYGDGYSLGGYLPDNGTIDAGALAVALGYKRLMYPEQGGDVSLSAGNDIKFAEADTSAGETGHFFSDWIARLGGDLSVVFSGTAPNFDATTWGIWASYFRYGDAWWNGTGSSNAQGMAVLGGGNLTLEAGLDIVNLNAALPVTGKQVGVATTDSNYPGVEFPQTNVVQIIGGGDLIARAGRDIVSPRILVDKGLALLSAGGSIGAVSGSGLDAIFGLADTDLQISARNEVAVAAVFNSTVMPQSELLNPIPGATLPGENYFFTYSDRARIGITSTADDINLNHDSTAVLNAIAPRLAQLDIATQQFATSLYPANLQLTALSGNIGIGNGQTGSTIVTLFPSTHGQLNLFAAGSIGSSGTGAAVLNMLDMPNTALAGIYNPAANWIFPANSVGETHTPIHTGDTEPVWITALKGDISDLLFSLPKLSRVFAGRDIEDTNIAIQNTDANSISQVMAGRDINYPLAVKADGGFETTGRGISVAGSGRLDVIAGRDINLRLGSGIQSLGNINNAALPDSGADVTVMAGINGATAATDEALYTAFAERYFNEVEKLLRVFPVDGIVEADSSYYSFIDWFGFGAIGFQGDAGKLVGAFTGNTYSNRREALRAFDLLPVLTRQAISLEAYQAQKAGLLSAAGNTAAYTAASGYNARYSAELVDFVSLDRFSGDLTSAVSAVTGQSYSNNRQAAAAMALLPVTQQHAIAMQALNAAPLISRRELVLDTLMAEVRWGGVENAKGLFTQDPHYSATDGFDRSKTAIALMFPGDKWQGSLDLAFSSIQNSAGGDINLFAPGGNIDVGLAGKIPGSPKTGDGISTSLYGAINSVVSGNINVNQSKIFSLDGAPITLWSSLGDIDAGKGAKTAISVKPPIIKFNPADGSVTLEFPPSAVGSGIQAASNVFKTAVDRGPLLTSNGFVTSGDTLVDRQRYYRSLGKGDVYLFAPEGTVNAGDAGISVAGNLLIAAQQVVGADNISVGGISIGVPTTTSIGAGTLSLGDVASSATESATNSMNDAIREAASALAESGAAFVTVDIIGVGN